MKVKDIKNLLKDQDDEIELLMKKVKNAKKQFKSEVKENTNIQQRYTEEIFKAKEYSITNFAKDLLGVRDDLQRAVDYSSKFDVKE